MNKESLKIPYLGQWGLFRGNNKTCVGRTSPEILSDIGFVGWTLVQRIY